MTPKDLKRRLEQGEKIVLLDVREPHEVATANLGGIHIPLGDLTSRIGELNPDDEIVVMCHHGIRSMHATNFLRHQGFEKVWNLAGGIDRWSQEVDPTVPRY